MVLSDEGSVGCIKLDASTLTFWFDLTHAPHIIRFLPLPSISRSLYPANRSLPVPLPSDDEENTTPCANQRQLRRTGTNLQMQLLEPGRVAHELPDPGVGDGHTVRQRQLLQRGTVAPQLRHAGVAQLRAARDEQAAEAREPHHVPEADVRDTRALGEIQ